MPGISYLDVPIDGEVYRFAQDAVAPSIMPEMLKDLVREYNLVKIQYTMNAAIMIIVACGLSCVLGCARGLVPEKWRNYYDVVAACISCCVCIGLIIMLCFANTKSPNLSTL